MLPDRVRVQHMLDATRKAIELTRPRTRADLETDEVIALALTRLLEIVGEAASRVSEPTRSLAPQVPWRLVSSTRNRLIHGYFDVDLDVIWEILVSDLPALETQLVELVRRLD